MKNKIRILIALMLAVACICVMSLLLSAEESYTVISPSATPTQLAEVLNGPHDDGSTLYVRLGKAADGSAVTYTLSSVWQPKRPIVLDLNGNTLMLNGYNSHACIQASFNVYIYSSVSGGVLHGADGHPLFMADDTGGNYGSVPQAIYFNFDGAREQNGDYLSVYASQLSPSPKNYGNGFYIYGGNYYATANNADGFLTTSRMKACENANFYTDKKVVFVRGIESDGGVIRNCGFYSTNPESSLFNPQGKTVMFEDCTFAGFPICDKYVNGSLTYTTTIKGGIVLTAYDQNADKSIFGDKIPTDNGEKVSFTCRFWGASADTTTTFPVLSVMTPDKYMQLGVCMKVDVNYMLLHNVRTPIYDEDEGIYGAPVKIDGTVYIPIKAALLASEVPFTLSEDGMTLTLIPDSGVSYVLRVGSPMFSINGDEETLNHPLAYVNRQIGGETVSYLVMALDDVDTIFGNEDNAHKKIYASYDDMGLIALTEAPDVLNRTEDPKFEAMTSIMKKFVFDKPTGDEFLEDVRETTNNFQHPYLLATADRFDTLSAIWQAEDQAAFDALCALDSTLDPTAYSKNLHDALVNFIANVESNFKRFCDFNEDGSYKKIKSSYATDWATNPNLKTYPDGYDVGGRISVKTTFLQEPAFAYQITKNVNYAKYVYDRILIMGEWEHWGPNHFLNCADATDPAAFAFDWAYNGMVEAGLDPKDCAQVIFDNGIHEGYLSMIERRCEHTSNRVVGWDWLDNWDNWNAVCNSGMTVGSLAIAEYEDFQGEIKPLMEKCIWHMWNMGLIEYAPDGSYYESATYWNYGTNNLFVMCAVLDSAAGTDYGIMNGWGLDKTCTFAAHSESSDFQIWAYHDANGTSQGTEMFTYVARRLEQRDLAKLRQYQIENGKSYTYYDFIFFDASIEDGDVPTMALSYFAEGMDGWVTRSSWEKGALYTAFIGGDNDVAHGDLDSGSFIYYNLGEKWLVELGPDDYNVYRFFGTEGPRWQHYKQGAEGQNILIMTSEQKDPAMKYGMDPWKGWGEVISTYDDENGSYAIIDNGNCYGSYVGSAKRGLLLTNSRTTVVIQDEVSCPSPETFYWIAHVDPACTIEISQDGRMAYLTKKIGTVTKTIRLTISSQDRSLTFEKLGGYDFLLDATYRPGQSEKLGGVPEKNRDEIQKLVICAEDVTRLNLAVVIEEVSNNDKQNPVKPGYVFKAMSTWSTSAIDISSFTKAVDAIANATTRTERFNAIAEASAAYNALGSVGRAQATEAYAKLAAAIRAYNAEVGAINTVADETYHAMALPFSVKAATTMLFAALWFYLRKKR